MSHAGKVRREQILSVAEELFAERGFINTNLDLVADRLGLRRQAIYYYFRSKDDILIELVQRGGEALRSAVMPVFDGRLPPRDALVRVVVNHVEHILANAVTFRVQFSEVRRMAPESIEQVRRDQEMYVLHVAAVIQEGQDSGDFVFGPPVPMALMLLGMCNATLDWYQPGRMAIPEVSALAAATAMNGVALRPS